MNKRTLISQILMHSELKHTFLKCVSMSGLFSHISIIRQIAVSNTPAADRAQTFIISAFYTERVTLKHHFREIIHTRSLLYAIMRLFTRVLALKRLCVCYWPLDKRAKMYAGCRLGSPHIIPNDSNSSPRGQTVTNSVRCPCNGLVHKVSP